MEKQDISNTDIDWINLIRHVARDQVAVELLDGPFAIAEVVPRKKPVSIKDLAALMAALPSLGQDAVEFAKDIDEVRKNYKEDDDPWEL